MRYDHCGRVLRGRSRPRVLDILLPRKSRHLGPWLVASRAVIGLGTSAASPDGDDELQHKAAAAEVPLPNRILSLVAAVGDRSPSTRWRSWPVYTTAVAVGLRLGVAWQDHDLVWPSQLGTPLSPRNVLRHLHQTCERAGIRRISLHTLRALQPPSGWRTESPSGSSWTCSATPRPP